MDDLALSLDRLARDHGFSGAVRVDLDGDVAVERAYGLADRRHAVPNTPATRFATASVTKGLTALTVLSLVESGALALDTPARALLGDDLPLVADDVTVEHLLSHRAGVGDYVDEDAIDDIRDLLLPVPVGRLAATADYLAVLDGHPSRSAAGERFAYCNSGYVILALIAERAAGRSLADLVTDRVLVPAGMHATGFLRSDELPADAAVGYLDDDGPRSNVHHLPVRGSGDGGCYSTLADLSRLWTALDAGDVVSPGTYAEMTQGRSTAGDGNRYGLGFWLAEDGEARWLEGYDAGVSAVTRSDPARGTTWTVLSNTTDGAWPLARHLRDTLGH